jgi:hypothetical protein
MRKYSLFVALALGVLSFQEAFSQQIEFVGEEIELMVADSSCTVNGLYWFRNSKPVTTNVVLFYPFVVNEKLPYPDTINIVEVGSDRQVKFTRSKNGIYFGVNVLPSNTTLYRVTYTQRTYTLSMQYILQTTAQWGKPLEQAVYRVRIPDTYVLTSSTMIFQQIYKQDGEQVYEDCEEHFMPSTDFIIQWERRLL